MDKGLLIGASWILGLISCILGSKQSVVMTWMWESHLFVWPGGNECGSLPSEGLPHIYIGAHIYIYLLHSVCESVKSYRGIMLCHCTRISTLFTTLPCNISKWYNVGKVSERRLVSIPFLKFVQNCSFTSLVILLWLLAAWWELWRSSTISSTWESMVSRIWRKSTFTVSTLSSE